MDYRLEVVAVPVSDVDASIAFYRDQVGFHLDHDVEPGNGMRVVQLTPPGSSCSIVFGIGMTGPNDAPVKNLHLVVEDVVDARAELTGRGVDVGAIQNMGGVKYAFFEDRDGNSWQLQELWRG